MSQENKEEIINHILKATTFCSKKCETLKVDQFKGKETECLVQCGYGFAASIHYQGQFMKYLMEQSEGMEE
ncbi:unnamed protein product [Paramecium sonneborni]|uniref:Uncharacterized protein n=1 Tax=Paramecium sonneborni TaxID=65129 RepID=A0A8S1KJ03_9CILI|nr:unnamed protein product [Paramecium sonneborni]